MRLLNKIKNDTASQHRRPQKGVKKESILIFAKFFWYFWFRMLDMVDTPYVP
jgi:hypothetical protein